MPKAFDVHTHTQFAAYENDYKDVIKRSLDDGIWILNIGTQRDTSLRAIEIADSYEEGVYATVGLHPIHTEKSYHDEKELGLNEAEFTSRGEEFDYSYYKKLALNSKVLAIGECGLDYYRLSEESKDRQSYVFLEQMKLSQDVKKPLMIHCRNAFIDLVEIIEKHKNLLNEYPGIVHFFTGNKEDASKLLDLGFCFSFGGVITFTSDYEEVIKHIPIENICLETDAPYVAPSLYRGKRNEPAFILETARKIGELKNLSFEEVCEATTKNARRVLKV